MASLISATEAEVRVYCCKFACTRYLPVNGRETLCKQSLRRWCLPLAPSVRRCLNKFTRYGGEPYGLATRAADLKSNSTTGILMTIYYLGLTSCGLLLVHLELWANEDSSSVGKQIKQASDSTRLTRTVFTLTDWHVQDYPRLTYTLNDELNLILTKYGDDSICIPLSFMEHESQ